MKVRVISAAYRREEEGVTIEIFGRAEDGRSVTALYKGFHPYFHVVLAGTEDDSKLERGLMDLATARDDPTLRVRDIQPTSLWVRDREGFMPAEPVSCIRVTVDAPWRGPEFRQFCQELKYQVLAADIPFHHRFFYDLNLGGCIEIEGEDIDTGNFTTDRVLRIEAPQNARPVSPELKILSFDIETSITHKRVLCICAVVKRGDKKIITPAALVQRAYQKRFFSFLVAFIYY